VGAHAQRLLCCREQKELEGVVGKAPQIGSGFFIPLSPEQHLS
jgi:hypothetical protein